MSVVALSQIVNPNNYEYNNNTQMFTLRIGTVVVESDSAEKLDSILNIASVKSNKELGKLREIDLISSDSFSYYSLSLAIDENKNPYFLYTLNAEGEAADQKFNDEEYFGEKLPSFPPGTNLYFNSNLASDGVQRQAGLDGLRGTAESIYNRGYAADSGNLANLDNSSIAPATLLLLKQVFGENTVFNQGHLNTLKMMGLVTGKVADGTSAWTLSSKGQTILDAFGATPAKFIPSVNLLKINSELSKTAESVADYFTATGYKTGTDGNPLFSNTDVEAAAARVLESLNRNSGTAPLPAGLQYGDYVQTFLNKLFGLPSTNNQFDANHINAAVAMGLLSYDAAANKVTLKSTGELYLRNKSPEVFPPKDNATNPDLKAIDDYIGSLDIVLINFDLLDSAVTGVSDGVVSIADLEWAANNYGADTDIGKAARNLLEANKSKGLDMLMIGNMNNNDHAFNKPELQLYMQGLRETRAEWSNTTGPARANGYAAANTAKSRETVNELTQWIPDARREGRDYVDTAKDGIGRQPNNSGNAGVDKTLYFGDDALSVLDAEAYLNLMSYLMPA